jgi:tetratricopeptide (TPR) repeat protein
MPSVYFFFADHLAESGKKIKASENYLRARELLPSDKYVSSDAFLRAAEFFSGQGSPELAMEFLKTSLYYWPDNPGLITVIGDLYEIMDMPYSAVREYKRALHISPGYYMAEEKLKRLENVSGINHLNGP